MSAEDGFSNKAAHIRKLAALPPDGLADYLGGLHKNLESVAPNIAPHIHNAAANAIGFLNSKLPGAGNGLVQDPEQEPSEAQKAQWLELHSVVNDPASVFKHIENGTLNHHHMEAMDAVYPALRQEMAQKAGEGLGKMAMKGQELPYQRRLQMGLLMGQPLDSTMTPQSMQAVIQANAGAVAKTQGEGGPKKASGVELDQLNKVNELAATPIQRRQMGKD